jgi:WD40 repeat protein
VFEKIEPAFDQFHCVIDRCEHLAFAIVTAGASLSFEHKSEGEEQTEVYFELKREGRDRMPPTGSFPWHCHNCGRVNDGGQLTCTFCGGLYTSGDPPGPPHALAHRPGKRRISRRFFLLRLTVSIALLLSAGGWVFAYLSAYLSYTPFRTLHTFTMRNNISSIAWSPDSRVFAAVTRGAGFGTSTAMMSVWHTSDGRELYTYSYPSAPRYGSRLAWSPDGRSFAIAWDDGTVNIWGVANDYASWQEQSSFHLHVNVNFPRILLDLSGIAWSADGKHLVMSYMDGELHVWDTVGGHLLPPVQAPQVAPQMSSILALSPDGTQAIVPGQQTSSNAPTYAVWDVTTGNVIPLPSLNMLPANAVSYSALFAWSPDGKALAVSDERKVMTWQWNKQGNSWTFVRSMYVSTPNRGVSALAWSPDRKRLATADSPSPDVVRMWRAFSGELLGPFRLPWYDPPVSKYEANGIIELAWSPDGQYLLSANNDGQVILQVVLGCSFDGEKIGALSGNCNRAGPWFP